MKRKIQLSSILFFLGFAAATLALALPVPAAVPAPPVDQSIGMRDVGDLTEAECRGCHAAGVRNRHDALDGMPIPPDSVVPHPDANGDGIPDTVYGCSNCHDADESVPSDCAVCHGRSNPHHPDLMGEEKCTLCHGSFVDSRTDGHYIPTYPPSLVTPWASKGDGLPLNSRGKGAGACNYCHDGDLPGAGVILTNDQLHHRAVSANCDTWCHGDPSGPVYQQIRGCEGCHGPNSLHYIQADSPKAPTGTIVIGGELAGYGHVGRDAGPGDSDCWGCHGFDLGGTAPAASGAMPVAGSALTEADCRGCHDSGVPDRHHLLYNQGIPPGSLVPYPDSDGNGSPDTSYVCLSCHGYDFRVVRDCTVCHSATNPHPVCGDGIKEGTEECDDGNTQDGDCCSASCMFEPMGSPCADGKFCNGTETCDGAGSCQAGTPVRCSDGVACTNDACDEANDVCMYSPDNSNCANDGLFCTGQEICDRVHGCVSTGNPCLSGTTCYEPADICIPVSGKVSVCHIPAGNPAKAKTLSVDAGAVLDHLGHGDTFGACKSRPRRVTR